MTLMDVAEDEHLAKVSFRSISTGRASPQGALLPAAQHQQPVPVQHRPVVAQGGDVAVAPQLPPRRPWPRPLAQTQPCRRGQRCVRAHKSVFDTRPGGGRRRPPPLNSGQNDHLSTQQMVLGNKFWPNLLEMSSVIFKQHFGNILKTLGTDTKCRKQKF